MSIGRVYCFPWKDEPNVKTKCERRIHAARRCTQRPEARNQFFKISMKWNHFADSGFQVLKGRCRCETVLLANELAAPNAVARATSTLHRLYVLVCIGFCTLNALFCWAIFKVLFSSDTYTCFIACNRKDACAEFAECARFAFMPSLQAMCWLCECIRFELVLFNTITITYCALEFLSVFGPLSIVMQDELNTLYLYYYTPKHFQSVHCQHEKAFTASFVLEMSEEQMLALNHINKRQKSSIFNTSKSLEMTPTANKRSRSGILFFRHRIAKGKHTIENQSEEGKRE